MIPRHPLSTDFGDNPGVEASPWVVRFGGLVVDGGEVLDVACGGGRHTRFFLERGHRVIAVDRDISGIADLADRQRLEAVKADLEGEAWPFEDRRFAAVVVTNYLHRPLLPLLVASVAPNGVLIYETFAAGQERFGRPHNPDYLLRPGELLEVVRGHLRVVAFEDFVSEEPSPRALQRICAIGPSRAVPFA
jgi:SAM-dependent methyltransferase